MEKTKILIVLFIWCFSFHVQGQSMQKPPFVGQRLMSMSLGMSGGIMAFEPVQDVYFTGSFSYCIESQVAIRTDINIFFPDANFQGQLDKNSGFTP